MWLLQANKWCLLLHTLDNKPEECLVSCHVILSRLVLHWQPSFWGIDPLQTGFSAVDRTQQHLCTHSHIHAKVHTGRGHAHRNTHRHCSSELYCCLLWARMHGCPKGSWVIVSHDYNPLNVNVASKTMLCSGQVWMGCLIMAVKWSQQQLWWEIIICRKQGRKTLVTLVSVIEWLHCVLYCTLKVTF